MAFVKFAFWIGLAIAILVFLKMSSRIPLERRLLTAALIPVFLVLLFLFISTIIAVVLVLVFLVLLFSLLSTRRGRLRRY